MATSITRELELDYSNIDQYATGEGLSIKIAFIGEDIAWRLYQNGVTQGTVFLNDSAMAVLYPNATAKPYKADSYMYGGNFNVNTRNYCELRFGGDAVHKVRINGAGIHDTASDISLEAVTNSNRSTQITYFCNSSSAAASSVAIYVARITLYFWQYAMEALAAGNGVTAAAVSDAAPYEGDSVTYTATLKPGATWNGWYSDAECTQLVSTEQSYTVVAGADMTLYASATVEYGTGLYVRDGGTYAEVQSVYKKVNGVYVQQDDISGLLDTSIKYIRGT